MSQHKTKYNKLFSIILAAMAVAISLVSCRDDLLYRPVDIPDEEVEMIGEVVFKPLSPIEIQTRADKEEAPEGNVYSGITSLYVLFFEKNVVDGNAVPGQIIEDYSGPVSFQTQEAQEGSHAHVTFKKRVWAGDYYVYAVANVVDAADAAKLASVTTVTELRNIDLTWNDDVTKDNEMFGVFKISDCSSSSPSPLPTNSEFEEDNFVTITSAQNKLHAWVRRATSKVTVDFDGTNLLDGVTVYIKKAYLNDVASGSLLGAPSMVAEGSEPGTYSEIGKNNFTLAEDSKYVITYGEEGEGANGGIEIVKGTTPTVEGSEDYRHAENAKALPCYENLQGDFPDEPKKKHQDSNEDGIIDSFDKDNVANGTYLEVEGYYVANRPEYKSEGKIIYRFMLGQNADNDFNLLRNHHYKVTMNFKGYGNDIDWHIVYEEKYLDVSVPMDVNYKGEFFKPSSDYRYEPNAGQTFSADNSITVTSYKSPGDEGAVNTWIDPEVTYSYYDYNEKTGECDIPVLTTSDPSKGWLTLTESEVSSDNTQKIFSYVASMAEPLNKTPNELFLSAPKGLASKYHNLSNSTGEVAVQNTANCYMIGAPGFYCFPLVYGNAIKGGNPNPSAYPNKANVDGTYTKYNDQANTNKDNHFVTHLGNPITKPYIVDNEGITLSQGSGANITALSNIKVKILWQDAENLIDNLEFDPKLFNGKGGIKFHVDKIVEGNAVIALIDKNASEDEFVTLTREEYGTGTTGSTKAIWSWHIWATPFGFNEEMKETDIKLRNRADQEFEVLPINLGWCSNGQKISYYPRRKCVITFTVGNQEISREIVQYPHYVLPRGDHPYYQWGRKDPFVGTLKNEGNKERWIPNNLYGEETATGFKKYGVEGKYNPPRLYNEPGIFYTDDKRKNTEDCLHVLVKNPDKWHNATRLPVDVNDSEHKNGFYSTNVSIADLWSNNGVKTVYDPCPVGYQVGSDEVFTGFTRTYDGTTDTYLPQYWNDVLEDHMTIPSDYEFDKENVNCYVLELYTDTRKIQSITFPVTGYRDYDDKAVILSYVDSRYDNDGFINSNSVGFVWSNKLHESEKAKSYHLKFQRGNMKANDWKDRIYQIKSKTEKGEEELVTGLNVGISPKSSFYNCDGFAVRPVKEK